MAKCYQAPGEPLGPHQVLNRLHVHDAMLGDDEAQELPGGDSEYTLLWVELDVVGAKAGEGFL